MVAKSHPHKSAPHSFPSLIKVHKNHTHTQTFNRDGRENQTGTEKTDGEKKSDQNPTPLSEACGPVLVLRGSNQAKVLHLLPHPLLIRWVPARRKGDEFPGHTTDLSEGCSASGEFSDPDGNQICLLSLSLWGTCHAGSFPPYQPPFSLVIREIFHSPSLGVNKKGLRFHSCFCERVVDVRDVYV